MCVCVHVCISVDNYCVCMCIILYSEYNIIYNCVSE